MEFYEMLMESKSYLEEHTSYRPELGMILGSGLGNIGELLEEKQIINAYRNATSAEQEIIKKILDIPFWKIKRKTSLYHAGTFSLF